MATPVISDLRAAMADYERRMHRCGGRMLEERRTRLSAAARALPRPDDILALARQRLDMASGRLSAGLQRNVDVHARQLAQIASPLKPGLLDRPRRLKAERMAELFARSRPALERSFARLSERVVGLDKLRLSLDPNRPLSRGFARVERADGHLAVSAAGLVSGEAVVLTFADGKRGAVIDGEASTVAPPAPPSAKPARPKAAAPPINQGDLF
jgi:exodeoxyribonuclease VII large subunit